MGPSRCDLGRGRSCARAGGRPKHPRGSPQSKTISWRAFEANAVQRPLVTLCRDSRCASSFSIPVTRERQDSGAVGVCGRKLTRLNLRHPLRKRLALGVPVEAVRADRDVHDRVSTERRSGNAAERSFGVVTDQMNPPASGARMASNPGVIVAIHAPDTTALVRKCARSRRSASAGYTNKLPRVQDA